MTSSLRVGRKLSEWCEDAIGVQLAPDEAAVFLAAALALLPGELATKIAPLEDGSAPESVRSALRTLWLRSGRAEPAATPMPEHPLSPSLLAICWHRLRSALTLAGE
ncbi:MAG TPA: hypothetical protein VMK12_16525 [Anaeromyxobacteraceae bacterium]|nr:hypothetical protein [Anaeromyxobacteraceae bacterium]